MPEPQVELLYFPGCPNVPAAREQLRRALAQSGLWAWPDLVDTF